jgi:hypothetical protein
MEIKDLLRGVIKEIVESRIRETDITDGSRVPFGSPEHVTDLEMRIADLERWRDRQRRGSEQRANYARLITRLRAELRSANRVANPSAPALMPMEDELSEADGESKPKKKKKKCKGCGGLFARILPYGNAGGGMCGSCAEQCPASPAAAPAVTESVDPADAEYSSIEDFVQFMLDDERDTYTHEELGALNFRTRTPVNAIRKELEGYGLTLANRPNEKKVRGFNSNSNDRWYGPGSMATHGGAGIDPTTGRATARRSDV